MNKHLKTLLIVSAISLSTSACSHFHGKSDAATAGGQQQCKIMKSLDKAKVNADKTLKELDNASTSAIDAATKKRIGKLIKDADRLSNEISKCKKICDVKTEGKDAAPAKKAKHHKKSAPAAAKPAADAKAAK